MRPIYLTVVQAAYPLTFIKLSSLRGNAATSKSSAPPVSTLGTRRSTRLLGSTGTKTQQNPKVSEKSSPQHVLMQNSIANVKKTTAH